MATQTGLFAWGDESRYGQLQAAGQPFGNIFVARKGNRVVYCVFSGVYFDDAEAIAELLTPALDRLDAYES